MPSGKTWLSVGVGGGWEAAAGLRLAWTLGRLHGTRDLAVSDSLLGSLPPKLGETAPGSMPRLSAFLLLLYV